MNETETFRLLKRPSYTELRSLIDSWIKDNNDIRTIDEVIRDNHWLMHEYTLAGRREFKKK